MSKQLQTKTFSDFQKLQNSVATLIRCRAYFAEKEKRLLERLEALARKMEVSGIVQQRNTIAIAGMQGTGKSTLLKNLYELPDNILKVNSNRGEKVPVFITEKSDLSKGEFKARRVYFDEDLCQFEEEIPVQDVARYSQGIFQTAYVELFVPYKYFCTDKAGFVLLPGFEKNRNQEFNDDYNSLMEYTLHFANAVVLVTNDDGLANHDIIVLIENLGKNFSPNNCVFAITSCDGLSEKACNEQIDTLVKSCEECGLSIGKNQITCTGEYKLKEENDNWKRNLIDIIENHIDYRSSKKEYLYYRPMIEEIQDIASNVSSCIDFATFSANDVSPLYEPLEKALKEAEKEIGTFLDAVCTKTQKEVEERFGEAYRAIPGKYKTSKKWLVVEKKFDQILEERAYVREEALKTLSYDGKISEFSHQISELLPTAKFYKAAKEYPQMLGEMETKMQEKLPGVKYKEVIRWHMDGSYGTNTQLNLGDNFNFEGMSKVITDEFNSFFLSMLAGNIDPNKLSLRTEGVQATINATKNRAISSKDLVSAVTLVDLLDGKSDIVKSVAGLFVQDAKKLESVAAIASGVSVIAIGLVAVAKKGLDIYNQVIKSQNAIGETWLYALKNAVEEQKNNALDSFREASEKLLNHIQMVHAQRMGVDAKRNRIVAAKYALADITALSNDFNDRYATVLKKRAK